MDYSNNSFFVPDGAIAGSHGRQGCFQQRRSQPGVFLESLPDLCLPVPTSASKMPKPQDASPDYSWVLEFG
jgi:hypothetical protein